MGGTQPTGGTSGGQTGGASGSGGSTNGGALATGGAGTGGTGTGGAPSGGSAGQAGVSGDGGAGMPPATGGVAGNAGEGGSAGSAAGTSGSAGAAGGSGDHWVGSWATGPQLTEVANNPPSPGLANNTLRQIFRVSIGGSKLRLRLSNEYGDGPVSLTSVHVAEPTGGSGIDVSSDVPLSFGGMASVTIPAGTATWSDPFDFVLAPLSSVAVSIRFGSVPAGISGHPGSRTTSYLQSGDAVSAATLTEASTDHWYYIAGLDVLSDAETAALVILGDSITDGRGSTTNMNDRWPDVLANRLQENETTRKIGVLNLGIGGNNVLAGGLGPPAKVRFDSQVLAQSGVKWLIVLEGVNDIGAATGAGVVTELTSAFQEFVTKARAANVKAYGSPILPFGGSMFDTGDHETSRTSVNAWVRTAGNFDAVVDLDAAVRDPGNPENLAAAYDSGDQLHPNPAGYRKMADAVDLGLFAP
jgi:lysophospholipase L1-like esterase